MRHIEDGWTAMNDEMFIQAIRDWLSVRKRSKCVAETSAREALGAVSRKTGLVIETKALPFYPQPNSGLVRVRKARSSAKSGWAWGVCANGVLHTLNGESAPIHSANKVAPLVLNAANALEYLHFFCRFVAGESGPFHLLSGLSDPLLPAKLIDEDPARFSALIDSPRLDLVDKEGMFHCAGNVFYGDALFFATFQISVDGGVAMSSDTLLVGDLPAVINAPML